MALRLTRMFSQNTIVALTRHMESFFIKLSCSDEPWDLYEILKVWPEADCVWPFFKSDSDTQTEVPLEELEKALKVFRDAQAKYCELKKLTFFIQSDVENIHFCEKAPEGFSFHYERCSSGLRRIMPPNAIALRDGWYRINNEYWKYAQLSKFDSEKLRESVIPFSDIPQFIIYDIPNYRSNGVNIFSSISYSPDNALELRFDSVETQTVKISVKWKVPRSSIDDRIHIDGYVLSDNTLRPGITPQELNNAVPGENGEMSISESDIAYFIERHYVRLKPYFTGDVSLFEREHNWINPPFDWTLTVKATGENGAGKPMAFPMARIDGEIFTPEQVAQLLRADYSRLKNGWVRRADIRLLVMQLGGMWQDGKPVKPLPISAKQLVLREDILCEPWKSVEFVGETWKTSSIKQRNASEHLKYLIHWGVNGAVLGGFEAAVAYAPDMLRDLFNANSRSRVLVLGSIADIRSLAACAKELVFTSVDRFDENSQSIVYTARFGPLPQKAVDIMWDLVVLIEPDELYETRSAMSASDILKIKSSTRISFFLYGADNCPQKYSPWQLMLLDVEDINLARLLIRDVRHPENIPAPRAAEPFVKRRANKLPVEQPAPLESLRRETEASPAQTEQETGAPEIYIPGAGEPLALSADAIAQLCDYGFRKSKFYTFGHSLDMDQSLEAIVPLIDARLRQTEGKGLSGDEGVTPTDNKTLRENLTRIVRYTEDKLRAAFSFPWRLRNAELEKPASDWIDAYLNNKYDIKSKSDKNESADAPRDDSDEVRDGITVSMSLAMEASARHKEAPESNKPPMAIAQTSKVLSGASKSQWRVIDYLSRHKWDATRSAMEWGLPEISPESEIEAVNRISLEQLGTELIHSDKDRFVVVDDYREELAILLSANSSKNKTAWEVLTQGLDDAWNAFFMRADLTVLGAVTLGSGALEQRAIQLNSTPELLTSYLNGVALETLGYHVTENGALSDRCVDIIKSHLRKR